MARLHTLIIRGKVSVEISLKLIIIIIIIINALPGLVLKIIINYFARVFMLMRGLHQSAHA